MWNGARGGTARDRDRDRDRDPDRDPDPDRIAREAVYGLGGPPFFFPPSSPWTSPTRASFS